MSQDAKKTMSELRSNYSNGELERIIEWIKYEGGKIVDVSGADSMIRKIAGNSPGDYNLRLLYGLLSRMKIVDRIDCSDWLEGKGYQKIDALVLTDSFFRDEIVKNNVSPTGQVMLF